jgi:sarcosine oxidase
VAQRYDVIVVGLGAMGSMACYHLAQRGVKVLGLEQFDIPNELGSSGGGSRVIRQLVHEHPDYVALLVRAYELWSELERESGAKLLHVVGGLYMGEPDCDSIAGAIQTAERNHLAHEVLDDAQMAKRFPQFHLPSGHVGVLEPAAGWLAPEKSIAAACHGAMMRGAELRGHAAVLKWSERSDGVVVETPAATFHADQILFCGGAWTSELTRDLGIELRVSRQVVGWVWPKRPESFLPGRLPIWSFRRRDDTRLYGFPMNAEIPGLKVANHDRSVTADPRTLCRKMLPGDEATFRAALRTLLPDADGPLLSLRICMYTNTADLHGVIGRHPRHPRAVVACGFSGHGFKLATVVGSMLADLLILDRTDLPCDFLSPARFK